MRAPIAMFVTHTEAHAESFLPRELKAMEGAGQPVMLVRVRPMLSGAIVRALWRRPAVVLQLLGWRTTTPSALSSRAHSRDPLIGRDSAASAGDSAPSSRRGMTPVSACSDGLQPVERGKGDERKRRAEARPTLVCVAADKPHKGLTRAARQLRPQGRIAEQVARELSLERCTAQLIRMFAS